MKKQILFFVGLLVSCTSNPILRDRNILRHDQEKLHQLFIHTSMFCMDF